MELIFLFFLFSGALQAGGTYASVVELYFLYFASFQLFRPAGEALRVDGYVVNVGALLAEEMGVGLHLGIEAGVSLVNGQKLCHAFLHEKFQGVVHRGSRQSRHLRGELRVDFFRSGVRGVFHQIVHQDDPLLGRLYLVLDQTTIRVHFDTELYLLQF